MAAFNLERSKQSSSGESPVVKTKPGDFQQGKVTEPC